MRRRKTTVVLHVISGLFSRGGTPRKLLSLVRAMDSNRFRQVFLLFGNCEDNLNEEMLEARAVVVKVSRPKNYDARLLWDMIRAVRTYQADIISTHFARADMYGVVAGILTGTPVIKNVHGILWNTSPWLQKVDRALSPFRACTVCNSRATLEAVRKQGSLCNGVVIYNGVPNRAVTLSPERVAALRASLGIPPDAFVIGHVGGLIPLRDQRVMIDAMVLLSRELPNAYLVLVGDGPIRQQLEEQAVRLGLGERVLFLGYRDDVPQLLATFDAYANMAYAEGFGIAVVEAMQSSLPVVLANAGALPELIEDRVSGLLVPPGDSASLAKALAHLESDRVWTAQIGQAARRRALDEFSIERYAQEFERLYRKVANRQLMESYAWPRRIV